MDYGGLRICRLSEFSSGVFARAIRLPTIGPDTSIEYVPNPDLGHQAIKHCWIANGRVSLLTARHSLSAALRPFLFARALRRAALEQVEVEVKVTVAAPPSRLPPARVAIPLRNHALRGCVAQRGRPHRSVLAPPRAEPVSSVRVVVS